MTNHEDKIKNSTEFTGSVYGPVNTGSGTQINNISYGNGSKCFDMNWAKKSIDKALVEAGSRYAPKFEGSEGINIKIPVSELFDGIGLTEEFWNEFRRLYGGVKRSYFNNLSSINRLFNDRYPNVNKVVEEIISEADIKTEELFDFIDGNYIFRKSVLTLRELKYIKRGSFCQEEADLCGIWIKLNLNAYIEKILEFLNCIINKKLNKDILGKISNLINEIDYAVGCLLEIYGGELRESSYSIRQLRNKLGEVRNFIESKKVALALKPYMLLVGDALIGKTHLLCDIAKERINNNLPTIIILGQHLINNEPPWNQIIKELGLSCSQEEFIKELDSWANRTSSRLLIAIDALNEGNGKVIWYEKLGGLLEDLKEYPNIGLVVSVRSSELNDTIRQDIIDNYFVKITHPGFQGIEYQALSTYCKAFNLSMPKIPVINPAFLNPGFLYILCKGLKNKGENHIPMGSNGLIFVLENFIDSIHERIYVKSYLGYDKYTNLVNKALNSIAKKMIETDKTWIDYEEAKILVNNFLPGREDDRSLFKALLSEGLINRDRFIVDKDKEVYGIRFSYQKFENYLLARYLLDTYLDKENPRKSFSENERLGVIFRDKRTLFKNLLVIDAFFIMIPERVNKEIFHLIPELSKYEIMCEKFIESLMWRNASTINQDTLKYINKSIATQNKLLDHFLDVLLTLASDLEHPYNANFLHKKLISCKLAERDAFWSTFIHYEYGQRHSVDRLIDWAWSNEDKTYIDDKSVELCATVIVWFFTSSNRILRDRSTKALVTLMSNRINIFNDLIPKFLKVNDYYVLERLFGAAYGCVLRSNDENNLKKLALNTYEWIFKKGKPPTHILLREYARGIIEFAIYKGIKLEIDLKKIAPPYGSKWISSIPTKEELQKYAGWDEKMSEGEKQIRYLYSSIIGDSDFARYVIGTNSGSFDWSSKPLRGKRKAFKKDIYEKFVNSLTNRQRKVWEEYIEIRRAVQAHFSLRAMELINIGYSVEQDEYTTSQFDNLLGNAERSFIKTIRLSKQQIFREHIMPYLDNPSQYKDEYRFDITLIQRYIFKRVLELGWTPKLFGEFDKWVNRSSNGREANKPERIGKKYQWIAYHEFLALISDNFEFFNDRWSDETEKYDGTWQLGCRTVRDIDPSCVLKKTSEGSINKDTWWIQYEYNNWDLEINNIEWLKKSSDLPRIEEFIEVEDPRDLSRWLALEGFYKWIEDIPKEEDIYENPRRELWYMVKSYIARKQDCGEVFKWAQSQNFSGRWMPEAHEQTNIFLGEFFWSPAFKYQDKPYFMHEGWTRGNDDVIPKEVLVTTDKYLKESTTLDCSVDEGIGIDLPCNWIVENMNLVWTGREGCYYDEKGELIVIDPSIYSKGPSVLLINKERFLKFLDSNGYEIIWTVLGEKNIIGGKRDNWEGRLEISGVYRLINNKVIGHIITQFTK